MAVREKTLTRTLFAVKHSATGSIPSAGAHKKFWSAAVLPPLSRIQPKADFSNQYSSSLSDHGSRLQALIPIRSPPMAQPPNLSRKRRHLVGRKLRPTHRRHRAAILFWLRHTFGYRFLNSGIAAIAPHPFLAR